MRITLNEENAAYVGWVPCLNGKLVFNLVECGLKDDNYREINIYHYSKDSTGSLVENALLHSTVNWEDCSGEDLNGLWSVILFSKYYQDNNSHEGAVYLMPEKKQRDKERDKEWDANLDIAHDINKKAKAGESIISELSKFQENLNKMSLNKVDCYKVDFKLEGNGIIWLNYTKKGLDNTETKTLLARQAYYYVKYAWHRHRHHDSRSETLTTIFEVSSNRNRKEIAEDLINNLKDNLVKFKRMIDHESHREVLKAKGIVSYTKALIETLKTRGFIDEGIYNKELNYLKYFKDSLDIISSGIEKDIAMHNQAFNDARAIVLFVFAIITPALVINKDNFNKLSNSREIPGYVEWINDLYSNEVSFLTFIGFIVFLLYVYISLQTRYGNLWIFWGCIKKSVAYVVNDNRKESFLSNTKVISTIMLLAFLIVIYNFSIMIPKMSTITSLIESKMSMITEFFAWLISLF